MKNRLKELREEKGLTLDDIENITGIKRGTFNNYENGKTEPKLDTWGKLASFFDVPISYLMGLTDDENDSEIEIKKFPTAKWNYYNLSKFQHKFQNPDDFSNSKAPKVNLTDDEKSAVAEMVDRFSDMVVGETIPYIIDEYGNKELIEIQKKNLKELEKLIDVLDGIVQLPFNKSKNGVVNPKDRITSQKWLFAILETIGDRLKGDYQEVIDSINKESHSKK